MKFHLSYIFLLLFSTIFGQNNNVLNLQDSIKYIDSTITVKKSFLEKELNEIKSKILVLDENTELIEILNLSRKKTLLKDSVKTEISRLDVFKGKLEKKILIKESESTKPLEQISNDDSITKVKKNTKLLKVQKTKKTLGPIKVVKHKKVKSLVNEKSSDDTIDSLKNQIKKNKKYLNNSLSQIKKKKEKLDMDKDILIILELSKEKFYVSDSILKLNKRLSLKIDTLRNESKLVQNDIDSAEKGNFLQNELKSLKFDNVVKKDTIKKAIKKKSPKAQIFKKLKTVDIKVSKKKVKYSIGDSVTFVLKEKAKFYLNRAKIELTKENIKKAKEYIDKSIGLNPSFIPAYQIKGDIYASIGVYREAIKQYQNSIILDSIDAKIYYNIGNCYMRLSNDKLALKYWSTAIEKDDSYILAYVGRASLSMKKGWFEKAIADYDKIFVLNDYFYPAYKGRGVAKLELGDFENAIIDLDRFLEYEPNDSYALHKRGLAKLSDNRIYSGCTDLLFAVEYGNLSAKKALRIHCER